MDNFISLYQSFNLQDRRNLYIALTIPILGSAVLGLARTIVFPASRKPRIHASPRLTPPPDPDALPYPPDALPGARDVVTPYGSIRVYEWGPEDGRKVLFVHGISTPCIAFAPIAKELVERGCRVMLFDLFGRGYSDAPDPGLYRQDIGLWGSQILMVLTSSKVAWTGSDRFTMVGYSMGGGISATFTSYFPALVESLILIAPGGLLRPSRISRSSKLLYGNLLPAFVVNYFVRARLRGSSSAHPAVGGKAKPTPADVAESEIPEPDHGHPANAKDSDAPVFPDRPATSIARTVAWEVDAHPGFLPSFISSIKYAPVSYEHGRWAVIGSRCEARRAGEKAEREYDDTEELPGLNENKVLVILGAQDPVIVADETEEDATKALGKENIEVVRLRGGHDVPVVNARGCVDAMLDFWDDSLV